jgi:flagellin
MTVASGTGYSGSTAMTGAQKDTEFNGVVTILSAGNDSGISVTITGTDLNGTLQTQTVTMANAGTATSTKTFGKVTDLSFSGNAAGNVTVGTISRADVFTVRGNLDLSNTTGGVVKVDTVADDTAANLASGATAETVLQKLGIQGQGQSFEVTGTKVAVTSLAGANASLSLIDNAIDKVALFRSSFGAVENRIDASINNLTTLKVNTEAARSRIEDADFAAETTNLTKSQILSQAATSMLAQANSSKQNLLALLQG